MTTPDHRNDPRVKRVPSVTLKPVMSPLDGLPHWAKSANTLKQKADTNCSASSTAKLAIQKFRVKRGLLSGNYTNEFNGLSVEKIAPDSSSLLQTSRLSWVFSNEFIGVSKKPDNLTAFYKFAFGRASGRAHASTSLTGQENSSTTPRKNPAAKIAAWADALRRLRDLNQRFPQQVGADGLAFLKQWGDLAVNLGWDGPSLFAVCPRAPSQRLDMMGLVPSLRGRTIAGMDDEAASVIGDARGKRLTFYRATMNLSGAVPVWKAFLGP